MIYCVTGASYKLSNGAPVVVLSARSADGRRVILTDTYLPYIFIPVSYLKRFEKLRELYEEIDLSVVKIEYGYLGVDGARLAKVTLRNPQVVSLIHSALQASRKKVGHIPLYEAHIKFKYRYLVDKGIITGVTKELKPAKSKALHNIIIMDIEVLSKGISDLKTYKAPLIVIGIYSYREDRYYILAAAKGDYRIGRDDVSLVLCKDEADLIEAFKRVYAGLDPDVIVTFTPFDLKYLIGRLRRLKVSPSFLSPIGQVSRRGKGLSIGCVDVLDYQELYIQVNGDQLWNSLDYIAKKELGYGKIDIGDISEAWAKDPLRVIEYNLRDVQLIREIEGKLRLIEGYIVPIWEITGLAFSECLKPSARAKILYLRKLRGRYILPPESFRNNTRYKGALVVAKPGLYHNVAILDWNEMYPSIMETFHISWETYTPWGGDIKVMDGVEFDSSTPGIANEMIKPLRMERARIKQLARECSDPALRQYYKTLSSAKKAVINSIYGLYKFFNVRIAEAITFLGREVFKAAAEKVRELGYELVYGDTDSVFIRLKTSDLVKEAEWLAGEIEEGVADYLWVKYRVISKLRLTLDTICSSIIILSKKRYHGRTIDGEDIIKGLEAVRKDSAPITVELERTVGDMLLRGESIERVKQYVDQLAGEIRGSFDVYRMALRKRCTKDPGLYKSPSINLVAAEMCRRLTGKQLERGERFYFIYVKPFKAELLGRVLEVKAIGLRDPEDLRLVKGRVAIDHDKMAEITIYSPFKAYLEAIGGKSLKQTNLTSFIES